MRQLGEQLRRDHVIIRAKLDLLQGALAVVPASWFVLRDGCFTLAKRLEEHCAREAQVGSVTIQHQYKLLSLQLLNHVVFAGRPAPGLLDEVCHALQVVITGLREELALQERELFPSLERWASVPGAGGRGGSMSQPTLQDDMTVNAVMHRYPETRLVFEQSAINMTFEGYDCLDEVAWRHGMESQELLGRLEHVIDSQATEQHAQHRVGPLHRLVHMFHG